MLFNTHDFGVALQFLLLLFAIFGLRTLADQTPPGLGKAAFATGVWAVIFVVLLVLLGVGSKIVSNGFYMFPQGILGAWLIAVNWRLSGALPAWQRWFGMIVGLGLVLTGVCFVGIAYVYFPDSLAIPQPAPENIKEVISPANTFFHQHLFLHGCCHTTTLDDTDRLPAAQEKAACLRIKRFRFDIRPETLRSMISFRRSISCALKRCSSTAAR
jgi:hypothetical protein